MALKRRRGKKNGYPRCFYLPGSALQLVPGGPRVVLSRQERDGAFIVVVAQKGFYPWNTKGNAQIKKKKACQCVPCVVFNSSLIAPDNTIKSKTILKRHGRNWNALLLPPETVVGLTGCKKKKKKSSKQS